MWPISLLLEFFIGVYDWLHIPVPIWIQVEGFVTTVRLRIQVCFLGCRHSDPILII